MSTTPKPRAGADDALAKIVTKDWFRAVAPKVIPPMHKAMNKLTRGRFVPGAGLVLYTTGAKSGKRRETPLEAVPSSNGSWVVVGSNFARESHPAWTRNLIAHPECEILVRGKTTPATATLLEGGRVYLVEGGVIVERGIEPGLKNWNWTEVKSGLEAGDRVVSSLGDKAVVAGAQAVVAGDEPAP